MALVDEIKIKVKAGNGGDGVVRWRHEKSKEFAGASGGNGGKGGDVFFRAVSDIGILLGYRAKKEFKAENGESGMKESRHGKDGEDLVIDVPEGSIVTNLSTGEKFDLDEKNEKVMVLKGGRGGLGNEFFKSSKNVTPYESTLGEKGEDAHFHVELLMIADIGLIGLPSSGKSSLLNALTKAHAKVGAYAFTTLEPNLGAFYEFIIADIPGLIEGASEGKGLGTKFLKHIKRTKILCHLISSENDNLMEVYKTIRNELKKFDKELLEKEEIVVLTKIDEISEDELKKKLKELKKTKCKVFVTTILDDKSIKDFRDELVKILRKKSS